MWFVNLLLGVENVKTCSNEESAKICWNSSSQRMEKLLMVLTLLRVASYAYLKTVLIGGNILIGSVNSQKEPSALLVSGILVLVVALEWHFALCHYRFEPVYQKKYKQ